MYRFNAKKGFIFYPKKTSETGNAIKTFTIGGENKGALYMIGLNIPQNNEDMDYEDFCTEMRNNEYEFIRMVEKALTSMDSIQNIAVTTDAFIMRIQKGINVCRGARWNRQLQLVALNT